MSRNQNPQSKNYSRDRQTQNQSNDFSGDEEYSRFSRDKDDQPTERWNYRYNSERNYPSSSATSSLDSDSNYSYGSRTSDQGRRDYQGRSGYGQSQQESRIQNYSGWDSDNERDQSSTLGRVFGLNHDYESKGRYSGMTPKNFKRSDDRIYDEICQKLSQAGHFDISDVEIKVEEGEVTLEGTVDNRPDKYRIEMLADSVMGVKEINNQLKTKSRKGTTGSGSSASDSSDSETSSRGTGTSSAVNKPRSIGSSSNR